MLTQQEKMRRVAEVPFWWHTLDLGDGVVTPGVTTPSIHRLLSSAIPDDLSGWTVLDVGAWDGYYSFACEKRGARVTAIDNNMHLRGRKGFDTARTILDSSAEFFEMDLFDLPDTFPATFDLVLFFGVLYHLKDPLRALEVLAKRTGRLLILESHYIRTLGDEPIMRFYPGTELYNDPTSWWGPNLPCILDMLRVAGFAGVELHDTYGNTYDQGRAIVKAWKDGRGKSSPGGNQSCNIDS